LKCAINAPTKSETANELAELKAKEIELKNELKMKEIEMKNEIKKKESILKEQLKQDIKTEIKEMRNDALAEEGSVFYKQIEDSCGIHTFADNLWERVTFNDYDLIFNKATTFGEMYIEKFMEEYETNKCCVMNESDPDLGYYREDRAYPNLRVWEFRANYWLYQDYDNGYAILLKQSRTVLYTMKECAKENGMPYKHLETMSKEDEEYIAKHIREAITKKIITTTEK
jgi:hypothetical protein